MMRLKTERQCKITQESHIRMVMYHTDCTGDLRFRPSRFNLALRTLKGAVDASFNVLRHIDIFAIQTAETICILLPVLMALTSTLPKLSGPILVLLEAGFAHAGPYIREARDEIFQSDGPYFLHGHV